MRDIVCVCSLSAGPASALGQLAPRQGGPTGTNDDGEPIDPNAPEISYCFCGNPENGDPDVNATVPICHQYFPGHAITARQEAPGYRPYINVSRDGSQNVDPEVKC